MLKRWERILPGKRLPTQISRSSICIFICMYCQSFCLTIRLLSLCVVVLLLSDIELLISIVYFCMCTHESFWLISRFNQWSSLQRKRIMGCWSWLWTTLVFVYQHRHQLPRRDWFDRHHHQGRLYRQRRRALCGEHQQTICILCATNVGEGIIMPQVIEFRSE